MTANAAIEGVAIGPMADGDGEAVRAVIADVLSRFEPMAVAAGQSRDEFLALVGLLVAQPAFRQFTQCARLSATGEMIGVMLATDFTTPMPDEVEQASPHFPPIGGVIGRLEEHYIDLRAPQAGGCLDLAMLAVNQEHNGKGIAQGLVRAAVKAGKTAGFNTAITMATNRASRRAFEKNGFSELFSVAYKDYTFDGAAVFAGIQGDDRTALMERAL